MATVKITTPETLASNPEIFQKDKITMENHTEYPTKDDFKQWDEKDIRDTIQTIEEKMLDGNGEFTETIKINDTGDLIIMEKGKLKSLFAHLANADGLATGEGVESLFKLAKKIGELAPELHFSFQQDDERRQITYTIKKVKK